MQLENIEAVGDDGLRGFGAVAVSPIRNANPEAQFGSLVLAVDSKADCPAQFIALDQHDGKRDGLTASAFRAPEGNKLPGMGFGMRMRNL